MWPFKPSPIPKLIAEILAPATQGGAQVKAIDALLALPSDPRSVDCFSRIVHDGVQARMVREKAMDALKRSAIPEATRALLKALATPDLRRGALYALHDKGHRVLLATMSGEACPALGGALRQIEADLGKVRGEFLKDEIEEARAILSGIGTPESDALLVRVGELSRDLRNRRTPEFLDRALKSRELRVVAEAVANLEKLETPEGRAALAKFRSVPSRIVEEEVPGGVGAQSEWVTRQVWTSKFGQPQSEEERAWHRKLDEEYEARQAAARPKPPAPTATEPVIHADLLALVANQLEFLKALHRENSLAPLAASMGLNREIQGMALTVRDDFPRHVTVSDVIALFAKNLREAAGRGEILASAIFFHGCAGSDPSVTAVLPASDEASADCIVALLDHRDGQSCAAVIRYAKGRELEWRYSPPIFIPRGPLVFGGPA